MSLFSIPTLRAIGKKLLTAPIITIENAFNPAGCIPAYNVTILGPTGSDLYYNTGANYPDPYCGDAIYSQYSANNTVILSNLTGGVGSNQIKAVACANGVSSSVAVEYFGGGACSANVTAPTIAYTQTSNISVSFSVTAEDCGITYINFGTGTLVEASPTVYQTYIDNLNIEVGNWTYDGSLEGYDGPQSEETTFFISAVTYFEREGCDTVASSVTSITDGPFFE